MCLSGNPDNWKVETSPAFCGEADKRYQQFLSSLIPLALLQEQGSTWERASLSSHELPRKEVIQPHLPVRLPCYDFTPITDPTLDACLPSGLAQRLQVLPTFVV